MLWICHIGGAHTHQYNVQLLHGMRAVKRLSYYSCITLSTNQSGCHTACEY